MDGGAGHPDQGAGNRKYPYQEAGNRVESRGDRNVIIQARDHANITVAAPFTGRGAAAEGYGAAASAMPTPGYTSLPDLSRMQPPRHMPRAFSQDGIQHSQEDILEDCIRKLQEMGFADHRTMRHYRQEVQNLISTGLNPQAIVQTIVERTQEHEETSGQYSTAGEITSSARNRRLVEQLPQDRAAGQMAREVPPSDGQDWPPIPENVSSSSEESEVSVNNTGESSTFDSLDGSTPTNKAPLYVALPEEKSPSISSMAEMELGNSQQNPTGGSPSRSTDESLSDESLRLQSGGYMQDNLASNRPEAGINSSADDGDDIPVRPLGDLYPESSRTMPALLDCSIPSIGQQWPPLSPLPAVQQNTVNAQALQSDRQLSQKQEDETIGGIEEPSNLREHQPTEVVAAASGEDTTADVGPDDVSTSDEETLPKVPPEEAGANEAAMEASPSDQLHPAESQEQVKKGADGADDQPVYDTERRLYIFTTAHIEEMTENFSQSKQIEVGAFGPIYFLEKFSYDVHGPSQDQPLKDRPLAIKVNRSEDQGPREFKQELVMAGYRHPHILPLIGICEDEGCLALIYAYMDNKDLLTHMKDQAQRPLNYKQRLLISLDLISAVLYYHRTKRFHRDIKSANVLLDGNYRARLGDPGLMRELPSDKSHLSHTGRSVARCGTTNYQDPYYVESGQFHETSDQFSAGKVLLELLTGKPADAVDEEGILLFHNWRDDPKLEYFRDNTGKGLSNVADGCWPEVGEDGNSVTQGFAKLIVGCLQPHPRKRIKLEVLYQELKVLYQKDLAKTDLAKTAGVLGTFSAAMPTVCTYCLACKPCPIPMACGCDYLICIACMKEHGKALYCPNHHADTTGLGQNTFAVIVGQQGFEKDAQDFRDAITNPNICAIREENVAVLLTATIQDVQKAVEQMGAKIKEIPRGQQTTFIYYHSGHAKKEWIPKQGPVSGLKYKDNAVTWSQRLKTILGKSGAHLSLFILDACFASSISVMKMKGKFDSNPSPSPCEADHEQSQDESTGRQDSQEQNMYDNILLVPEGCILWASSRGNEASVPDDNGKSIFTKYIVNGLQDGNCGKDSCSYCQSFQQETTNMGAVSLDFLQKYVWKHVTRDVPMRPSLVSQVEQGYWIAYKQEL